MAQIHERQIYVMTFGLYFEVPAKKIEISEKKYSFGPDFDEKMAKLAFSGDKIQNLLNYS